MTMEGHAYGADYEKAYFEWAIAEVNSGNPVWVRRNFDADTAAFDFFRGGKVVGCIIQDEAGKYEGFIGDECVTGDEPVPKEIAEKIVTELTSTETA